MLTTDAINAQKDAQDLKEEMAGCIYRHFKGELYIVTDVVVNSETLELEVIYKDFATLQLSWCRPLSVFLSGVDTVKHRYTLQNERFEKIGRCGGWAEQ